MIKFFRKIRFKSMETGKTGKYFKYAIGEIILVVIGILIALQINNWNENRNAKAQEVSSMKEIIENLKYDIVRYQNNTKMNNSRIKGLDSLRTSVFNTIEGKDETTNIYYYSLKYGRDFSSAVINRTTYNQMTNSGSIKNSTNKELVQEISDYYERIAASVSEFQPDLSLNNLLNMQKKFISYKEFEGYIQSLEYFNENTLEPEYDYNQVLDLEHLKLLHPKGLTLMDYYNEVSQFEIDLKNYHFYMSWGKKSAIRLIENIEKEYYLEPTKK